MNKKIVIIIIILFVIINIIYYYQTNNINIKRHLTNSYNYAHFSQINNKNYIYYPSLLFTNPIKLRLKEGESLYIPSKMWHWIESYNTYAINFWFDNENKKDNYKIIKDLYSKEENEYMINKINDIIKKNKIRIWDTNNNDSTVFDINGDQYINSYNNNNNFITLDGYDINNNNIKNEINKYINKPNIIKKENIDTNIWISNKYHDTGLHFDDYDGILHVLSGYKDIILYPESDSKYLYPYDLTPNYVYDKPIYMNYNQYNIINKKYNSNDKSSSSILYYTLLCFSLNKNIYNIIQKLYDNKYKTLVWGFKKFNDEYRWEIYNYHYDINNIDNEIKIDKISRNVTERVNKMIMNDKVIINSIDILNNNEIYNKETHIYERDNNNDLPFYGSGYDIINENKIKVGRFIYDTYDNIQNNNIKYLKELNLPYNEEVLKLLKKYKSEYMCIWNKLDKLFIQWIIISIDDFIKFLIENNYKNKFINYMIKNKHHYKNISHEITIVFDNINLKPIRSGFYGCL